MGVVEKMAVLEGEGGDVKRRKLMSGGGSGIGIRGKVLRKGVCDGVR